MFKLFRALSENKELTAKIETLESEKLKLNHEIGLLQNELNQTRETLGKLQIKQADASQEKADYESRMDKAREAYKTMQTEVETHKKEAATAQAEAEQKQKQLEELQLQLSENQAASTVAAPDNSAELAQKDQRITELENELAQASQQQLKLETQNKELTSKLENTGQQPAAPAAPPKEAKAPEDTSIIIVDDSITTRTLMKKILQAARYNVSVAKDGLEGKNMIEKNNPDIIVTDIEMPNMDGFELTQWVKSSSAHPDTPVIMITSLADEDFQARGREAGASSFITKNNFNQQTFLSIIEQNLVS